MFVQERKGLRKNERERENIWKGNSKYILLQELFFTKC